MFDCKLHISFSYMNFLFPINNWATEVDSLLEVYILQFKSSSPVIYLINYIYSLCFLLNLLIFIPTLNPLILII